MNKQIKVCMCINIHTCIDIYTVLSLSLYIYIYQYTFTQRERERQKGPHPEQPYVYRAMLANASVNNHTNTLFIFTIWKAWFITIVLACLSTFPLGNVRLCVVGYWYC